WCAAAVGVLCGIGLVWEAALGTVVVLCANVLLREAAQRMNRLNMASTEVEQRYGIAIVCEDHDEVHVRTLLLHSLGQTDFSLHSLQSQDISADSHLLKVNAEVVSAHGNQSQLEQIVSRVSLEKSVSSVRWSLLSEHDDLA